MTNPTYTEQATRIAEALELPPIDFNKIAEGADRFLVMAKSYRPMDSFPALRGFVSDEAAITQWMDAAADARFASSWVSGRADDFVIFDLAEADPQAQLVQLRASGMRLHRSTLAVSDLNRHGFTYLVSEPADYGIATG